MLFIDLVSIGVAVAVGLVTGLVWYGPLFGGLWQKETHYTSKELEKLIDPGVLERILLHVVGLIISAFVLSYFVARNDAILFVEGMLVGFLVWVFGAIVLALTGALHKESRHENVHVLLIDLGHWLTVFVLMAGILASMSQ